MNGHGRVHQRSPGSHLSLFAHFFGILAIVLMLVWLLHYGKGFDLDSNDPGRIFNVMLEFEVLVIYLFKFNFLVLKFLICRFTLCLCSVDSSSWPVKVSVP